MKSRRSLVLALLLVTCAAGAARAAVVCDDHAAPRVRYGAEKLHAAMTAAGVDGRVVVNTSPGGKLAKEGFSIRSAADGSISITGHDDSGALYGCLELASRITKSKKLPTDLNVTDAPAFVLRGPCIGMQKTYILPGRHVYEYPYTPELFPFFYDKQFWTKYFDFLAANRMNVLFLWSGHPFASLVRLEGYPYAQEVPDDVFDMNVEMFRYITQEADRRGIWVVQQFYSIILSKPFAEHNGLATQLSASTPLVDDYMRKSIAEFVRQYPHVGLMPCLGEALQGQENQTRYLCDVILPGIKDGAKQAGLTEEPPVVIRTHATDLRQAMPEALKVYKNLYTEAKFNGESLTTYEPRGVRQQLHLAMSRLGSTHLINVHILANLEPFRYGAPRFIQKCVQAGRDRLGARGLHLYPLSYWNWPDSPDATDPPLKQWRRDWIWFEAWARYAWNPDVPEPEDRAYWIDRLTDHYGNAQAAALILDAYNDSGECAPRILRRFGITEGNRQTMSVGMTLDELVDPAKYRPFEELWESQSPPGERLQEYVDREWQHQPHEGETPPQIIREIDIFSARAVTAIDQSGPLVTKDRDEFERLRNDVHCIRAMSQNYAAKANAAMCVLRYQHSGDIADMERAASYLAESLDHHRELVRLTEHTYRYANSMQTSQRKIPVTGGVDGKPANYHWSQVLPVYEKELADFRAKVQSLKQARGSTATDESSMKPLPKATVRLIGDGGELYDVRVGQRVWTDRDGTIESVAPELVGLTGIRISRAGAAAEAGKSIPVEFESAEPVQVLIGYFRGDGKTWRTPPMLETDAAAAQRGGAEPLIRNAATVSGAPPLDVHAMNFPTGRNKLDIPGGRGAFVILGFVPQSATIQPRDAQRKGGQQ